ncbi:MAG: LLM class flavin-dependent oxidoreductase, partial [Ktedonobacteraceae bacterium]|nr:LLM class flavin-dependent oxidoreductase [Ktedonobacteraceae bacterium]
MAPTTKHRSGRGIAFGLIFFSSSEAPFGDDKYRLVIESTKFADQHDFSSVWIPERHFTKDGWLYPNPAILQAALARETRQIQLRAGSVVLPLHNPLRVAEEWAMVDNLSNGRVGVSFASGWHPNDFALFPENYEQRSEIMYRGIETVRKLWRGEAVQVKGGDGNQVEIRTYPAPIQREIPIWITAAGNPKTFAGAGEIGANLLTHMYNQSVDELAEKIRIYRDARARSGYDPESGQVSVMLHTFIGKDQETVRAQLQGPFTEYLKSASYLVNAIAYSRGQKVDIKTLSEQDLNDYLLFVFDRLVSTQRVLFGTPESCQELVNQLKAAGVNEIACQMDFGVDSKLVLESMPYLNQLKELTSETSNEVDYPAPLATESFSSSHQANGHASTVQEVATQKTYIQEQQGQPTEQNDRLESIQKRCREQVSLPGFYQTLSERGIQLAASFQGIEELWRRDGEALGRIKLPAALAQEADLYQIHPTLLDACFQVLIAALPQKTSHTEEALYLPTGMHSFQQYSHPRQQVWS